MEKREKCYNVYMVPFNCFDLFTFIKKQIAGALDEDKPRNTAQPKIDPDLL